MTTPTKRFTEMTTEEILALATPTPDYDEIRKVWPRPTWDWSDQAAVLKRYRTYTQFAEDMDEKDALVEEDDVHATGRDGNKIRIHTWTSKRKAYSTSGSPLIVLHFGGGYTMGSPTQMAPIARELVKKFNAVVVAPDYRLAPEHPFPIPVNDCWDALKFIAANATSSFGADPKKGFIVGGYSAGATVSTILAHLARDEHLEPRLTGTWCSCGSSRVPKDWRPSEKYATRLLARDQEELKMDPLLSERMQQFFADNLQPDLNSHLYAPMVWPTEENHRSLPRTYFQIAGTDAARDEAFVYEDLLHEDGVTTKIHLYAGLPHCFYLSLRDLKATEQWQVDTIEGFQWLLQAS